VLKEYIRMNKDIIRKQMLERRAVLLPQKIKRLSETVMNKISGLDSFKNAKTVLFYYPHKNETDIINLIEKSLKSKTVCLPRIEKEKGEITARKIYSLDDLVAGEYGIMSPGESSQIIAANEIDFVVVPLVAYDRHLHRVGYGKGYFDRYLKKCQNAFKCGVAYSFQKAQDIDCQSHDIKLDMVVTEI